MRKSKKIVAAIFVFMFICITGVVLAAPTIQLDVTTDEDVATLTWTNNDSVSSYNYKEKRSVNGSDFKDLHEEESNEIKVLNVYPGTGDNITFNTADGQSVTIPKSASLKKWMEEPNRDDTRGYGRGLIKVTPVTVDNFNSNPTNYLNKDSSGKYNYDVVVFGTWDGFGSKDLNDSSLKVMKEYLSAGNSCVMGHDTILNGDRKINELRSYFNIKLAGLDNKKGTNGNVPSIYPSGRDDASGSATARVRLRTNNVFTTYPWHIGNAGQILTVPYCHCVGQVAYGSVEISFDEFDDITDQEGKGNWNYYLTVNNNCAMIQTGHSNCEATTDEEKIWANLLFYLGDIDTEQNTEDRDFRDINAPNAPIIGEKTLNGVNGTVEYTATDNGTKYDYYVEATERTTNAKTTSNTVTKTRITNVQKYVYIVDNKEGTEPQEGENGAITTTGTSLNYTLTDGPKTYLHIRAIDGAGNIGPVTHVLLHTNVPPQLKLAQNPTEWTNKDVTITATATDEDGRVVSIEKPDESVANSDTTTYVVGENNTYSFTATDNSGESTTEEIEITNIDKVDPRGEYVIVQPTEYTRAAVIHFVATDDLSGVAKIVLPDNSEIVLDVDRVLSEVTTYNVTEPGTYNFKVVDYAGNETVVEVPVVIKSDGLEVKYIDQVTKADIHDVVEKTGNVGDSYTTEQFEIEGYELVKVPDNAVGTFTMDKQTVTYEYRKLSKLITKHIDANTGNELIPDVEKTYKEGDEYTALPQDIAGCVLVESPSETTGVMGREDITKVFKYKKISGGLVVKYVDELSNEVLETKEYAGNENDVIRLEDMSFKGYILSREPEYDEVVLTVVPQEVRYYYKKIVEIEIVGKDEVTGEELYRKVETGTEGEKYKAEPQNIPGYMVNEDRIPDNVEGTYSRNAREVVFYYNQKAGGVRVRHIDIDTNDILDEEYKEGDIGDRYETKKNDYEKYVYVKVEGKVSGQMTKEEIEVNYYYKKKVGRVTVIYEDTEGNELLREVLEGKVDEMYNVEQKQFDGYKLKSVTGERQGTYTEEEKVVKFILERIKGKIVVKVVDEDGNELDRIEDEGYLGELFETDLPQIDGYYFDGEKHLKVEYREGETVILVEYKKVERPELPETGDEIYLALLVGIVSLITLKLKFAKKV